MSKELEALERLRNTFALLTEAYGQDVLQDAKIIENALQRLNKLDLILKDFNLENPWNLIDTLKVLKRENLEKYLKAFDIIKEKEVLSVYKDYKGICYLSVNSIAIEIPQKEYDLLKETLNNG